MRAIRQSADTESEEVRRMITVVQARRLRVQVDLSGRCMHIYRLHFIKAILKTVARQKHHVSGSRAAEDTAH